jgi:hypothetical protein
VLCRSVASLTTIELPEVQGRIDHMSIDVKGERLFISALGNNTGEVIDLKAGKPVNSISGLQEPQGALYVLAANRLMWLLLIQRSHAGQRSG